MKPQTIWASVAIVFILVGAACTLVILDKDVSIILTLAALVAFPVLGAFGVAVYHKLEQVNQSSNGSLSRALENQQKTQSQAMENQQKTQQEFLAAHQRLQDQLTALAMSINPPVVAPVSPAAVPEAVAVKEIGDHTS